MSQTQPEQAQYGGGGYYGYPPQGYEGYGYAPPPQDPNAYYGGYPGTGYGNYQQPGGGYQQQQQVLFSLNSRGFKQIEKKSITIMV